MPKFFLSGALALLLTAPQAAQQQTPQTPQTPQTVFRSGVDRVAVDVIVVDDDGRPVADLQAGDFSLEIDGKRRDIASAEFISLRRLVDPGPPPSYYASNDTSLGGRLIMIVVDQNNIKPGTGREVFDAAAKFLETLNPNDRVGLHFIPSAGPVLDFTANHALVAQMLKRATGRATSLHHEARVGVAEAKAIARNDQSTLRDVMERECSGNMSPDELAICQRIVVNDARSISGETRGRTAESIVGLRELMRRLSVGRTRKTVVLLSEGLILDQGIQDLAWVPQAAATSQVTMYVLQMESPAFQAQSSNMSRSRSWDRELEKEGLNLLAGLAGGAVVPLSPSNPWLGFSRVSTEVSGYYLLSFEPAAVERDGKTHKIKVGVGRRGLKVRARREFAMGDVADATELGTRLGEALVSPVDLTDVALKVAPYVLRDETGRLKVIITAEVDRTLHASNDAAFGYTLFDSQGRLAGSDVEPSLGEHNGSVQRISSALIVDPGIYILHAAAADISGRDGSVTHTFEARLNAAGQLHWSGLLLSEQDPATQRIALITDGPSGTTLQAYLELYSEVRPLLDQASVVVEISRVDDGIALVKGPLRFSAAEQPGRRTGESVLEIGLLGEGEFIARAIISVDGKEAGRALRPFVIKKRQP